MVIEFFLISGGILLLLIGVIGAFVPVLPGPPISYTGLLMFYFSKSATIFPQTLFVFGALTVLITLLDFLLPIWGTKVGKGSKHGVLGATLGLVIGIFFFPPWGIIPGPVLGAWLAERVNGKNNREAWRSAMGSFAGLFLGTIFKFVVSVAMIWYAIAGVIRSPF